MSYLKSVRSGSEGNTRLQKSYGGGSSAPRQCYATGGAVKGGGRDGPALSEGIAASGAPAKPNLARPGRKLSKKGGAKKDDKGDGKKAGATVNVVVMSGGKPDGGPPMPPPDMGPPPGPPPGPGGPPLPMRASGGRVVKLDAGAGGGEGRMEKARAYGSAPFPKKG